MPHSANIFRKKSTLISKIAIRNFRSTEIIQQIDVIYCEADGRYTRIYLRNKESMIVSRLLKHFESLLSKDYFFRIHKSYLVNINYILVIKNNNILILENNIELPIARRRKNLFIQKISKNILFV